MNTEEILKNTGLNWNVKKEELQTTSGLIIPDKIALVREDTNAILSVMGKGYEPYQNSELLELLYKINQSIGLEVETGGSFNGGGKVYFQLKSDDLKLNGDLIKGYVSGLNSFDGATSLSFGNATKTISCENTFWDAYRQLDTKLKHTKSMRPRIDEILKGIDALLKEEQTKFDTIVRMSQTQNTQSVKETVIRTMFELTHDEFILPDLVSTRTKNQIATFENAWARETAEKGDNLWGAMSAITRFTTHDLNKSAEKGQFNKMFGKTGTLERLAWNKLSKLAA